MTHPDVNSNHIPPEQRTFDYRPNLKVENERFLIRVKLTTTQANWDQSLWWVPGPVTNQGRLGSCVGHGIVSDTMASPVRVKFNQPPDKIADTVYFRAQHVDQWPGENYEGTSVNAGMTIAREYEWIDAWYWAKNLDDLRIGLDTGPVVIGVSWTTGMSYPDEDGYIDASGDLYGGHCVAVTGYSADYNGDGPKFRIRNSWGRSYGRGGDAYIAPDELNKVVFEGGNEAGVARGKRAFDVGHL